MIKKLKNIKFPYLRKYSYYCFFLILIFCLFIKSLELNNDIWFLLNHGKYVFFKGIPYIEPFTIHSDFKFIMQQWASSLTFFLTYHYLGINSLLFLVMFINILIIFISYKLCMLISDNNYKTSILTVFVIDLLLIITNFIVTRPQIFTYLFVLGMFFCLEYYIKKNSKKILFFLPIISMMQINFHASMWWLLIIFMIPYLLDGYNFKLFYKESYSKIPIIVAIVFMFLFALINPYGVRALGYVFNSYGVSYIDNYILEMMALDVHSFIGKFIFIVIIIVYLIYLLGSRKRIKSRYLLLLLGTTYMAFSSYKCFSYFVISSIFPLSFYLKNKLKIIKNLELYPINYKLQFGSLIAVLLILLFSFGKSLDINYKNNLQSGIDYLLKNYNQKKIILYVGYDQGGYTEFRGIKSYIDPRAEVFLKANNGKKDVFKEYYELQNRDIDYEKFLNGYNFSHVLVTEQDSFYSKIKNNKNYKLIYKGRISLKNKDSHYQKYMLYARKN